MRIITVIIFIIRLISNISIETLHCVHSSLNSIQVLIKHMNNSKQQSNNYNNKSNNNNGNRKFKRSNHMFYETPIPYVSKLDETKLELIKAYDEHNEYSVKLPIFNGKGGIKTFLHVLTKFLKAAQDDLELYAAHNYRYLLLISRFAKVLEMKPTLILSNTKRSNTSQQQRWLDSMHHPNENQFQRWYFSKRQHCSISQDNRMY